MRARRSVVITREGIANKESHRESVARDSRKKPVLASGDETRSSRARKFFCCQKSRLRVRAAWLEWALLSRGHADRTRSFNARITKTTAAQAFPLMLTNGGFAFLRTTCIAAWMACYICSSARRRASASLRQRFLKQDSVFLSVLVYSGCSAFRFPSARSDQVTHYIRRATWPRKLRRRRRRRAQ